MQPVFEVITGGARQESRDLAAADLEAMAVKVRDGTITEYSIIVNDTSADEFRCRHWSTPFAGVALATMLQDSAIRRMRE